VLLPDLPGHGSRYNEHLNLTSAKKVLLQVVEKEAPGQKVLVVGFSMGGYVAASFVAAYPHLVAGG